MLKAAYQVRFHKCHTGEHHLGQLAQPSHAYWQVYYTCEPAIPNTRNKDKRSCDNWIGKIQGGKGFKRFDEQMIVLSLSMIYGLHKKQYDLKCFRITVLHF